jgi:hypothetical protein
MKYHILKVDLFEPIIVNIFSKILVKVKKIWLRIKPKNNLWFKTKGAIFIYKFTERI